jgi:hypothetical protein
VIKDRTDAELASLAQAMEENDYPELGPAQGKMFDAIGADKVYRAAGDVDWREDTDKPGKCGLLLGRVQKKGLVELVREAVAGKQPWSLTVLGVKVDRIRNPERYDGQPAEQPAEDGPEQEAPRGPGFFDQGGRWIPQGESKPSAEVFAELEAEVAAGEPFTHTLVGAADGAPMTVETVETVESVLAADSPLGRSGSDIAAELVGKSRVECERVLGEQLKATLFYLADRCGKRLPKSARATDLVSAILGTSFPAEDDGKVLAKDSPLDEAIRAGLVLELAGNDRAYVEDVLTTGAGVTVLREMAKRLGLSVPKSANKAKLIGAILDAGF